MILFPEYREHGKKEQNSKSVTTSSRESRFDADIGSIEGLHVLVVDDQPDSARIVAKMLAQEGALVKWASSVRDALRIVDTFHPSLIISDLAMPQEDGFDLLRRFRASHSYEENGLIPLIAISAHHEESMMQKSFEEGFQAFLPKPVNKVYLLDAVAKLAFLHRQLGIPESVAFNSGF